MDKLNFKSKFELYVVCNINSAVYDMQWKKYVEQCIIVAKKYNILYLQKEKG